MWAVEHESHWQREGIAIAAEFDSKSVLGKDTACYMDHIRAFLLKVSHTLTLERHSIPHFAEKVPILSIFGM